MSKIRVFCDLDQTLCDLVSPVLAKINKDYKTNIALSDVKYYTWIVEQISPLIKKYWGDPSIYDAVEPHNGAKLFVDNMKDRYDFHIITHCGDNPLMASRKKEYIKHHFGISPDKVLCPEGNKHLFMGRDDILIDDYLLNIQSHIHHNNGYAILYNHHAKINWARYDDCCVLTDKHFYAQYYHEVYKYIVQIATKIKESK